MWRYLVRSLWARRLSVLPTIFAALLIVAAITVMGGLLQGVSRAIKESGRESIGVVIANNSMFDTDSSLPIAAIPRLRALPGIAVDGPHQLVSFEALSSSFARTMDGGIPMNLIIRGVDPTALRVHDEVKIVEGRMPASGEVGVVVGSSVRKRVAGLNLGDLVRIGSSRWPVIGVISSNGRAYDSEIWCDRTALTEQLKRNTITMASFVLATPEAISQAASIVAAQKDLDAEALTEAEYHRRRLKELNEYIATLTIALALLLAGAVLACANTMHASFATRVRELSTLVAIGYRRRTLAVMLLEEALLLTTVGGGLGLAIACFVHGRPIYTEALGNGTPFIFAADVSPNVILLGACVGLAVGLLGCIASVLSVLRLDVLTGLRQG